MHRVEAIHPIVHETSVGGSREEVLRKLLPLDYEHAQKRGLINMFSYDPQTGEDGLVHTLAGNLRSGNGKGLIPGGYHHEESAAAVWPTVRNKADEAKPVTYVDVTHLEGAKGEKRRKFTRRPLEPYIGRAVVGGKVKYDEKIDPATGATVAVPTNNAMYPEGYDAMAVLQTIKWAYDERDPSKDSQATTDMGEPVLVNESWAPLMDGKSAMPIRLVLTPDGKKIKTAVPVVRKYGGIMRLTDEEVRHHTLNTVWGSQEQAEAIRRTRAADAEVTK